MPRWLRAAAAVLAAMALLSSAGCGRKAKPEPRRSEVPPPARITKPG
jgi:predicted small lipoprotein YifL